jgi:3-deoxy-D-manno-octulosonate 8-phosphate phosphatase (KDO 8-P phosphatase)
MMSGLYGGAIRLVLFDVDGVLTDGKLFITGEGESMKTFHAQDGVAIALLRTHGIRSGFLSGKHSAALTWRAKQLRVDVLITGCDDKRAAYEKIKLEHEMADSQIAYVGDDIIDLPVLETVGMSYAPANAHRLVRQRVDRVTACAGGEGVAREVAEHILSKAGLSLEESYAPLLAQWESHGIVQ